jgi:hypothetical protein
MRITIEIPKYIRFDQQMELTVIVKSRADCNDLSWETETTGGFRVEDRTALPNSIGLNETRVTALKMTLSESDTSMFRLAVSGCGMFARDQFFVVIGADSVSIWHGPPRKRYSAVSRVPLMTMHEAEARRSDTTLRYYQFDLTESKWYDYVMQFEEYLNIDVPIENRGLYRVKIPEWHYRQFMGEGVPCKPADESTPAFSPPQE